LILFSFFFFELLFYFILFLGVFGAAWARNLSSDNDILGELDNQATYCFCFFFVFGHFLWFVLLIFRHFASFFITGILP
jgi:hypothetical protein